MTKAKLTSKKDECTAILKIEVPRATIDKAFDEVYDEITRVANIPGFRVGKAPKEMVRKQYVKDASDEVLKRVVGDAYRDALTEHKIHPVGMPEITDMVFAEGKPLSFTATVETHPTFTLRPYTGITVEKKNQPVTDDDIMKTIDNIREINAKYTVVDGRPVQLGDYVVGDVECFVDDKPIHKKRENLWMEIDKESLIPGLHEKMVGMQKGETRDIEVTLPEQYPDKKVAGKKARYHVLVKEIKSRHVPALDDAFAKDLGKENVDAVKKEVREGLAERERSNQAVAMENQLLKKLVDDNSFAVPPRLVSQQRALMIENAKERLVARGFKKEDLDARTKDLEEKFKDEAVRQVRLLFILGEIAHTEHIDVTDGDLEAAYAAIAAQAKRSVNEVKAHYEKEDMVDNLREKIREEKTIRFLLDKAKVVEK